MKKVIHIITGLGQGGAETMLYKLLSHMDVNKFQSIVISMTEEGIFGEKIRALGIPVYCLRMNKLSNAIRSIFNYRKIIKENKPDIVHAWMYHANFFAMVTKPFLAKHKIFFNIRVSLDGLKYQKKLTRFIIKLNAWLSHLADGVVNNSIVSQQQHAKLGFSNKNAIYIGNGFELTKFKPCHSIYFKFRDRNDFALDTKVIGMFARFHPIKNHFGFLETAKIISKVYPEKIKFLMAGVNVDKENTLLINKINELELNEKIILLGNVDTAKYLPACDLLIVPSFAEGFPNIVGEAMACGVPCVATHVSDLHKIIGNHGYVVPINNVSALAECAIKVLSMNKSDYEYLSHQCRTYIEQNFSLPVINKQYEELYLQQVNN